MNDNTTRKNSCTVHETAGSSQDSRTRSLKRKASLDRTTSRKRTRVSEPVEPSTSSGKTRKRRRDVEDDEEEPFNMNKRMRSSIKLSETSSEDSNDDFISVPSLSQEDEEEPSFQSLHTILADTVRANSDPLEGCSKKHRQSEKRKAADVGEGPSRKKSRNQNVVDEDDDREEQRAQFEAMYQEQHHLGEGGCGYVFAGYRKSDNLPVAIKHIPKDSRYHKEMEKNKKQLSPEVSIMLKLHAGASGSVGSLAPIALLDWFDLSQEEILVLERPVPSKDLLMYIWDNGASLEEDKAKIIVKQLIDAAIHLENINIFHRDIKLENILLETGSDSPCLRLIDFGLSCVVKKRSRYHFFYGTPQHIPPEWYSTNTYTAGPTTVWQIGVTLFDMLHSPTRFETTKFLDRELEISRTLSKDCRDFLQKCVTECPKQRPTLNELRRHLWLR